MRLLRATISMLLFAVVLPLYAATFPTGSPATTNNDDSCDIALLPAATLLIPYFEVSLDSAAGTGETTLITVTNVTNMPQIARVTMWTDFSFPVMTFNVYLTGYDVQSLNLFDIIRRGQIAPNDGTGSDVSPVGSLSGTPPETDRDNPRVNEASCNDLPVQLPSVFITRMREAFTRGIIPAAGNTPECRTAGGTHTNAVGYVTIDAVNKCGVLQPTDAGYIANDLGFENVLIADYLQVNGENDFAQTSPAVHIRAVGEGGDASGTTNLRRTFYSRLLDTTADRRQPLPSTFAARWISGGATSFQTSFKIFREAQSGSSTACSAYAANGTMPVSEIVRFDENENPEVSQLGGIGATLGSTSLANVTNDALFPPNSGGDVAGWMYLNLDDIDTDTIARQAWVVVSMRAAGRFSGDMDAPALGNGCSAPVRDSNASGGTTPIGPAPNATP